MLTGGAARAAYQAGVLRGLARRIPGLRFPLITGVSAGAINATYLAAHPGSLVRVTEGLCDLWASLHVDDIFRVDAASLAGHFTRWAARLVSGTAATPEVHGLVDTRPLLETIRRSAATVDGEIVGIERNLARGRLRALALTALNYSTGQTVTWIQGHGVEPWSQPEHRTVAARISAGHIMASAALPLFFPAVRLGDSWYGDGGIRLSTPLVPALRLGATRLLAITPRYEPSFEEANRPKFTGYPPPAGIISYLLEAIFLDVLDEDARRLQSLNSLLTKLPPGEREGLRLVDLLVLRPSRDLALLARDYESHLPAGFRHLVRSLGTRESESSELLSMLMFVPEYLQELIALGDADAEARLAEVRELVEDHGDTAGST